jgi:hypothetical protein
MAGEVEETALKLIAEMMRSYSQILKAVAEIEQAGGQPFDEMLKKLFSPEKLAEMRNRVPPKPLRRIRRSSFQADCGGAKTTKPPSAYHRRKKKLSNEIAETAEIMTKIATSKQ